MPSEIDLAYIAGFVDGEGCIGIHRENRRDRWFVRLEITNTDLDVLVWIKSCLGGTIHSHSRRALGYRTVYRLIWSYNSAAEAITLLYPYLRVKNQQAEVALAFDNLLTKWKRYSSYTKEEIYMMEQLAQEAANLNTGGE